MAVAGVQDGSEAYEKPKGVRLILVTISLLLAPLIQVFDTSILSIALSQMQGSLSATQDQIAWVLTSYLIAVAIATPLWGALGQTFGRKPLLLVSIAGFLIFSIFAAKSTTLEEILIHRFIQGIFGASLIPLGLSSLLANYERKDFSFAMSFWGVGIMFGPVFGPTIGGYIVEYYNWRWAFYLNVPVCILAFVMIAVLVPRPGNRQPRKFNYYGFVLLALTVATAQFILDRGQRLEWFQSPLIIFLSLVCLASLWMFIVDSMTSKTPFIDPAIFADKNYLSGTLLRILFGLILFGSLVIIPPFLQNQGGYTLLDSGILMAPRGAGTMFGALFLGRLIKVIDPRRVIFAGMLITAYTMWEFSRFTGDVNFNWILIINFIQGFGFSCFVIPVNTVAFSTLPEEQRDVGTSFYSLLNNIGRSLGIAILAGYLASQTQTSRSVLTSNLSPFSDFLRHIGLPPPLSMDTEQGRAIVSRIVSQQAELVAYVDDFRMLAILILVCSPVIFLMGKSSLAK